LALKYDIPFRSIFCPRRKLPPLGLRPAAYNNLQIFQPLIKNALGRELWNVVDVVVGIGLILSVFIKPKRNNI